MTMQQRCSCRRVIVLMALILGMAQTLWAEARSLSDNVEQTPIGKGWIVPVQVPYEAPPKGQNLPAESVPQNTKPLTPEEVQTGGSPAAIVGRRARVLGDGGIRASR